MNALLASGYGLFGPQWPFDDIPKAVTSLQALLPGRQISPRVQHLLLSLRVVARRSGRMRLEAGLAEAALWEARVWGPGRCGRSRRPHRGNHSAARAPPCRPQDCHRLWGSGHLGHRFRK
uniref:Kinesin associated protein 3 n=1 Tax=Molossus molossus TaxID=27622 RepID=A0A7J8CRF6_MOLMO|nr:kinesin associated protein 3 [Molossus molossus]